MRLLIIAPCLLSPFYVYRGPKEKELRTATEIRRLLAEFGDDWHVLAYPCPEFELLGWPRPPMSREVLEALGIREKVEVIADFIGRVLTEEKPETVVFVGVKGSPTCGVFTSTSSDPEEYPIEEVRHFFYLSKGERLVTYGDIIERAGLKLVNGEGGLFAELRHRFGNMEAVWLEFDKDNIGGSILRLQKVLKGLEERPKS
ncbi:hypothetical protein [Pyrococcus yayanosii]|uniref:DUF523 domain-containing protein n=1 Tax=Pyrococcus yayanosii (strain CH1 / JCM 16557) TaxID=529709 RepID=F8AHD8_PYRYC|nr:hypothetical protein [Pyrococcus yayanosii]AEH24135.1 hypothetical protein PYCH_04450 [Pyrococcus yayanosii CH1]